MRDASQIYAQVIGELNRRDWKIAADLSSELLSLNLRHAQIHCMTGIANMELRQLTLALRHLQAPVDIEPARADFMAHLAMGLLATQQTQKAHAAAKRSRNLYPMTR